MASLHSKRLIVPLAPLGAGVVAALVALIVALLPADLLGRLVLDSGIAALVPAAEPPLGATARAALILIGGGGIGLIAWFTLFLLIGTRSISLAGRHAAPDDVPVLRRADAHPDAPARRPLFAAQDLGTPFLDVRAPVHVVAEDADAVALPAPMATLPTERALPADLDLPLSSYGPDAPAEDLPIVSAPLVEVVAPVPPRADIDPSASLHSLLDRLEQAVTRRTPAPSPTGEERLQESLASLRRLAIGR